MPSHPTRLAGLLPTLTAALLLSGCGVLIKPAPPQPVVFMGREFQVTYPGAFRPVPPVNSTVFMGKEALPTTVYDAGRLAPTVGYASILVSQLSPDLQRRYTSTQLLDLVIQQLKKRATILSEDPLPQAGYVGKSLTVQAKQKGEAVYSRVDYIVAKDRLFQVTLSAKRPELLKEEEYRSFFTSFTVK
ncbi:hypothetical protein [Anthocerotibacter panamensis]|uniref:hypothetical protein n=1 Tax=Anthocerotibacter panamensis TaxID=2857077 RepID=UPI001C405C36|nr:hypothetical protein [Anthocerotibacter panamensis]